MSSISSHYAWLSTLCNASVFLSYLMVLKTKDIRGQIHKHAYIHTHIGKTGGVLFAMVIIVRNGISDLRSNAG